MTAAFTLAEESPSYIEAGLRITTGYRKVRESATENRQP